jgi:hypothetical protein
MSGTRRIRLLAAVGAAAVVVGCTSAAPTPAPAPAPTPAPAPAEPARILVPDAFTAVTVRALSPSTFPVKGTDGKYHIAYDLQLTNSTPVPATITKLEVVDAVDPAKVVAAYSGAQLVDPNCEYGDCARLQQLPQGTVTSTDIPAQESRAIYVDYTFDTPEQAPKAVLHHFYGTGAVRPGRGDPAAVDYLAAPLDIAAAAPRVIGPPVRGDHWIALNGCCLPGFPHRTSLATFNGELVNGQRFAIDWKQTTPDGRFFTGDPTKNESYVDYGAPIYAVADGTISSTLDTLEPNTPGVLPAADPVLREQITVQNVDGNHIVQDLGGGVWAFYAHLLKGSLTVKPGDRVSKGQVIAKLGNTGNSNADHLHFHLMNGPSVLGSDGLPYVIDSFAYEGQVDPQLLLNADGYISGQFFTPPLPAPQPRTDELPLNLSIVNFPT